MKASALQLFKFPDSNPTDPRTWDSTSDSIETQSELDDYIKDSVSVAAPIQGVDVKVSASYLNKLKVSDTQMCIVIEAKIMDPSFQAEGPFKLTEDAKGYLERNGSKEFLNKYGE